MKSHILFIVIILAAFALVRCTAKQNFDLKVTIVPATNNYGESLNDMKAAADVISTRLNKSFGIPSENMKLDVAANKILLSISKADNGTRASVNEVITEYARLELRETYENSELVGYLTKANDLLKQSNAGNSLSDILKLRVTAEGKPIESCIIGLASEKDTATVSKYFQMPEIRELFPAYLQVMWSQNPYKYNTSQPFYELHALKMTSPESEARVDGSMIVSAKAVQGRSATETKIDLSMNAEGTARWAKMTRDNIAKCIAVVVNGHVRSYPRVQNEITGGKTEITGDFSEREANELVNIINSGRLPVKLRIADEQILK